MLNLTKHYFKHNSLVSGSQLTLQPARSMTTFLGHSTYWSNFRD